MALFHASKLVNSKFNFTYCQYARNLIHLRFFTNESSDYTEQPQYPPIENISPYETYKIKVKDWHLKVEKLPTVEQKLIELNMPKYYGFRTYILNDKRISINGNKFLKFVTRTSIVDGLPEGYYKDIEVDHLLPKLKPKIEELIYLHNHTSVIRNEQIFENPDSQHKNFVSNFITDLNNLLLKTVQEDGIEFSPTAVDLNPRLEGFWLAGGFPLKTHFKNILRDNPTRKDYPEYDEYFMRSTSNPTIGIRSKLGLPEPVPIDDQLSTQGEIPLVESGPNAPAEYGVHYRYKRACIVSSVWPGLEEDCCQLFIYPRSEIIKSNRVNNRIDLSYDPLLLENKSMIAGFTQNLSYAFNQGFTYVNEVTYPFTCQSVTTDGQNFQFHIYQMNTCALHTDRTLNNPRNNILWKSEDLPLFESLEGENVKGLNEEVLKLLLKMYMKKGVEREDPHPYLADYKYLMHHDAPKEYKTLFQQKLLRLMREQDQSLRRPYMDPWEYIYKVLFKTRPMDPKRKWFETDKAISPHKRRLDEYQTEYINRYNRINPRIKKFPRINSEHLFLHDYRTLRRGANMYPDDDIAFKTLNVLPNSDRYRSGKSDRKWRKSKTILHKVDPNLL